MEEVNTKYMYNHVVISPNLKMFMFSFATRVVCLHQHQSEFVRANQWAPHEEAIETCRRENLLQAAYFLQRDMTFMKDVSMTF